MFWWDGEKNVLVRRGTLDSGELSRGFIAATSARWNAVSGVQACGCCGGCLRCGEGVADACRGEDDECAHIDGMFCVCAITTVARYLQREYLRHQEVDCWKSPSEGESVSSFFPGPRWRWPGGDCGLGIYIYIYMDQVYVQRRAISLLFV
ncbi:hypothetical protein BD289DRAFT_443910 [Coniella lustricola]|uniref:Uncharacterized protein n=1 Tax=Coniella lustricola TaxID=2025994 RepID=A0A2T2ZWI0_9PEZI|nr:hypothetical protein BD289DRAFT_443910 [Coniella lustricola]